ncbi:unnamed protein product [Didymodactylos carnosus]|uniref:Retrotransposon gag domain-containing protein n=1 Tax=Didymodactylos carnosus TaxID=1234261 RepID=A0A814F1I4_9BILA|nr:unnamed protein product [Didymodactylos carnosus]CAF3749811.1 unnamed protein product [Didymodactylos carnosus]
MIAIVRCRTSFSDAAMKSIQLQAVRAKLTDSAADWFDDSESQFTSWQEFEHLFKRRCLSVVSTQTKFDKLVKRVQQPNEPIVSYYDDVLRLCREVDANMTSMTIVQHLISGVRQDVREQLLRPDSPTDTPEKFFKIAKKEEDLKQISQPVDQPVSHSYFSFNDQPIISAVNLSLSDKRLSIPSIQSNQARHSGATTNRQPQQYPSNQYCASPNTTPFRPFYFRVTGSYDGDVSSNKMPSTRSISRNPLYIKVQLMYGRQPVLPFDQQSPVVSLEQDPQHLNKLTQYLSQITDEARQNIIHSQQQYKTRYDSNRTNPEYDMGDLLKNHQYAVAYPPFRPPPYDAIFINKLTSKTQLNELIQRAATINHYTVDTEGDFDTHEPALLQIQFISAYSIVLLVEVQHLPPPNSERYHLIAKLLTSVFNAEMNSIYAWGDARKELSPFLYLQLFQLRTIEQTGDVHFAFQERDQLKNPHLPYHELELELHPSELASCKCETCIGRTPDEPWSLQDMVVIEFGQFWDKQFTKSPWTIGLDPLLHTPDQRIPRRYHRTTYREQLKQYGIYDCLTVTKLVQIIQAPDPRSPVPSPTINAQTPDVQNPRSQHPVQVVQSVAVIRQSPVQSPTTISSTLDPLLVDTPSADISKNDDSLLVHRPGQPSAAAKKRLNRKYTLNRRKPTIQYRHEIVVPDIYHKFTPLKVKFMLRQRNIPFTAILIDQNCLYIGMRTREQQQH